jgi:hypothetical protein
LLTLGHSGERGHQTGRHVHRLAGARPHQGNDLSAKDRLALSRKLEIVQLCHHLPVGPADHRLRTARTEAVG